MIKNWIVKTKQIRHTGTKYSYKKIKTTNGQIKFERDKKSGRKIKNGFVNHVNYLHDSKRAAHKKTNIQILLNNANTILKAVNDRKEYRQKNKIRGGHLFNIATSFVLSLPSDLKPQPTYEQWLLIGERLIKDVAMNTEIDFEIIKKHTHIVLHDEGVTIGKNSHIHVLVSNVIDNKVIKKITQRATTSTIKKGFNESVKTILGVDHMKYTPIQSSIPDKPLWLARQEKSEQLEYEILKKKQYLKSLNITFNKLKQKLNNTKNDISNWAKSFLNNIFERAEVEAETVAKSISAVEHLSSKEAKKLDDTVFAIEQKNTTAPKRTKVSNKRNKNKN